MSQKPYISSPLARRVMKILKMQLDIFRQKFKRLTIEEVTGNDVPN
jgi:hypothetical protein